MITEKDLLINNKSYTNKDFVQIYSELLQLAKELSNKYDPEASNESDPFIVILKLLGFIGDKINYNVDKNILERFMPSATQESSMRELCDMLGYPMHYYIAPVTKVNVEYLEYDKFTEEHTSFVLPAFTTIVTDNNAELNFVVLQPLQFTINNLINNDIEVMQGTLKQFEVINSNKVQLENLDQNNRLFFSEPMVAQNGVFIEGGSNLVSEEGWRLVDNLNNQKIKDSVYRFGYDSEKKLPYIEFPQDIADLIGDGLTIRYIVTNGASGNVRAKSLTKINSSETIYWDGTEDTVTIVNADSDKQPFSVANVNASINGKDPETIDEAYNGFKKTIGTFDTLVSCRDYANYIYSKIVDEEGNPVVSNVQVADRRTDINYCDKIVTYNQYGQDIVDSNKDITAFDLVIYPLKPLVDYTLSYFNDSFNQLLDTNKIINNLEFNNIKTISHDYKELTDGDIFALKNYYKITANIATTHKVNEAEQLGILNNINTALIKKFNAREVDFGYEIPYDELLKTIEKADERIKLVNLYEPEINTKVLFARTGDEIVEKELISEDGKDAYVKLLAKNILAGRYPLFNYDESFNYDFGQEIIAGESDMVFDNVKSFTSTPQITISTSDYILQKNEYVQFVFPSYINSDATYSYGIPYCLVLNGNDYIDIDTDYELGANELCVFVYKNDAGAQVVDIFKQGDILHTKEKLYATSWRIADNQTPLNKQIESYNVAKLSPYASILGTSLYDNNILKAFGLATSDEVVNVILNEQVLEKPTYCYWIVNDPKNRLPFDSTHLEYTLQEGEYFFTTNLGFTDLFTYGPGTLIKVSSAFENTITDDETFWTREIVDVAEVIENGLLKCKDKFELFSCDTTKTVKLQEQAIYTLTEGDKVKQDTGTTVLTNNLTPVSTTSNPRIFTVTLTDGTIEDIKLQNVSTAYLNARARLDLNVGYGKPQALVGNQQIAFKDKDGNLLITLEDGASFQINAERQVTGGTDVNIYDINYLVNPPVNIYPKLYCYSYDNTSTSNRTNSEHYESIAINNGSNVQRTLPSISEETSAYVMIYKAPTLATVTLTVSPSPDSTFEFYSVGSTAYEGLEAGELKDGVNVVKLNGVRMITLTASGDNAKIILSQPRYTKSTLRDGRLDEGYNEAFNLFDERFNDDELDTALRDKLHELDENGDFNYINYIENSKIIETQDFTDPYSFYDSNNIANKWTISQIDFNASADTINIVRGSKA